MAPVVSAHSQGRFTNRYFTKRKGIIVDTVRGNYERSLQCQRFSADEIHQELETSKL